MRTDQTGGKKHPFRGIFLMPFLGSVRPNSDKGPTARQLLCPRTPTPNNLGTPVVRFDIWFTSN